MHITMVNLLIQFPTWSWTFLIEKNLSKSKMLPGSCTISRYSFFFIFFFNLFDSPRIKKKHVSQGIMTEQGQWTSEKLCISFHGVMSWHLLKQTNFNLNRDLRHNFDTWGRLRCYVALTVLTIFMHHDVDDSKKRSCKLVWGALGENYCSDSHG